MEWRDLPPSQLTPLLNARALRHPTNSAFDETEWQTAFRALEAPTHRDADVVKAAIHYGRRLQAIRAQEQRIPLPPNQPRSLRLLAACANQQALTVFDKSIKDHIAQLTGSPEVHFEQVNQRLLSGAPGQSFTADDLNTIIVDALPHWLHRISKLPLQSPIREDPKFAWAGRPALEAASLTTSLKTLWQSVLWLGHGIDREGQVWVDTPRDKDIAEQWFVWDMRRAALARAAALKDLGLAMAAPERLPPVTPVVARTVVRVTWGKSGKRRFHNGPADPTDARQRSHATELSTLENLYIGQFLDEVLPALPDLEVSCRDLNAAWCVLTDLARLVTPDLARRVQTDHDVGRLAFPIDRSDLSAVLQDALGISLERARGILDLLTCNMADSAALFGRGVWASPLLPDPTSDRCYLLLGPLLFGSPTRRIEAFMLRGGIADTGGVKGRGKPFEAHVRRSLAAILAENAALPDAAVYPEALHRKICGQEIDLIVRIGATVLIGEIKCLVAPSEALEKYNYLDALDGAAAQAAAKLQSAEDNRALFAALFDITDEDAIAALRFQPLVLLNQGMGAGLSRQGVPIVDHHYLSLLLGATHYQGEARFQRDGAVMYESVPLYRDQADFEQVIAQRLASPVVLERYRGVTGWRRVAFYWPDMEIELPTLVDAPVAPAAVVRSATAST